MERFCFFLILLTLVSEVTNLPPSWYPLLLPGWWWTPLLLPVHTSKSFYICGRLGGLGLYFILRHFILICHEILLQHRSLHPPSSILQLLWNQLDIPCPLCFQTFVGEDFWILLRIINLSISTISELHIIKIKCRFIIRAEFYFCRASLHLHLFIRRSSTHLRCLYFGRPSIFSWPSHGLGLCPVSKKWNLVCFLGWTHFFPYNFICSQMGCIPIGLCSIWVGVSWFIIIKLWVIPAFVSSFLLCMTIPPLPHSQLLLVLILNPINPCQFMEFQPCIQPYHFSLCLLHSSWWFLQHLPRSPQFRGLSKVVIKFIPTCIHGKLLPGSWLHLIPICGQACIDGCTTTLLYPGLIDPYTLESTLDKVHIICVNWTHLVLGTLQKI